MSDETNVLEVQNLEVKSGGYTILSNINFKVKEGETLAIIGPNGAGKSVLFRTLLGLMPASKGNIVWREGVRIGYVPQKLFVDKSLPLSVREFLHFKKDGGKIKAALELTGLKDRTILNKKIGTLSGGELQRVLIAWAIIDNPDVLLFDEPLTGIDIGGEETIYSLLHSLSNAKETTVIMISHDLGIVYKYAGSVLCLNKKQICLGTPMDVINEENTKRLYGGMVSFHDHRHETI